MEEALRFMAAVNFIVIGLSHIAQPRVWINFFIRQREKGDVGVFLTAFLHLPIGSLIVAFHPVWTGVPVILTVIGWAYIVKSLLYFTYPKVGMRSLRRVSLDKPWEFVVAGAVLTIIGGLLLSSLA